MHRSFAIILSAIVLFAGFFIAMFLVPVESNIGRIDLRAVLNGHKVIQEAVYPAYPVPTQLIEVVHSGREVRISVSIWPTSKSARNFRAGLVANPRRIGPPNSPIGEEAVLMPSPNGVRLFFRRDNILVDLGRSRTARRATPEEEQKDIEEVAAIVDAALRDRSPGVQSRTVSVASVVAAATRMTWDRFMASIGV